MDAGPKERFRRVYISESAHLRLVQKNCLDITFLTEYFPQILIGETFGKRLGRKPADLSCFQKVFRSDYIHVSEMTLVLENQPVSVFEVKYCVGKFWICAIGC